MPYRTELRRPDLKGTFRCSLCNKIFCHSSSLSRHRMQAHFKSYTCTLCNKEITSNETLRAHMYKKHQISRMFMCRCCNWAFPDKTSLHIHMQAMATGNPGNVSIIAKSSTSPNGPGNNMDGHFYDDDENNNIDVVDSPTGGGNMMTMTNESGVPSPNNVSSIFPQLGAARDEMLNRLRERALFGNFANPSQHAGLDLASLFPNFQKFNHPSLLGFPPPPNLNGLDLSNGNVDKKLDNSCHQNGSIEKTDIDDDMDGTMADIEYGDSVYGSDDTFEHDGSSRLISPPHDEQDQQNPESVKCETENQMPVNKKARYDSNTNNISGIQVDVKLPKNDSPAAPPLVNASPLNSLLYHKKLTNVLRNKRSSDANANAINNNQNSQPQQQQAPLPAPPSFLDSLLQQKLSVPSAAAFFGAAGSPAANFASPLLNLHQQLQRQQQLMASTPGANRFTPNAKDILAAAGLGRFSGGGPATDLSQSTKLSPLGPSTPQIPSGGPAHFQHIMNQLAHMSSVAAAAAAANHAGGHNGHRHPAPSSSDCNDHHSSTTNSHVSPTETASTKSSTSKTGGGHEMNDDVMNGGRKSSTGTQPPADQDSPPASPCFQCQVLKGRLALCENRARFLQSRTTSQESKISRLESRLSTLETNQRRYETEAVALRKHCEALERALLDCQERALKCLAAPDLDGQMARRILHDVLETCRVYGSGMAGVANLK